MKFLLSVFSLSMLIFRCFAGEFTVATYNIRVFRGMNNRKNIPATIAAIGRLQSDVCALQEIRKYDHENPAPLFILGEKLRMSPFFCRTLRRNDFDYGIGAVSRFKAEKVVYLKLPSRVPSREPRAVMILKIHTPDGIFYLVNTHLCNGRNGEADRMLQMKFILDHLEKNSLYPAILTGDFNAVPASAPLKLLDKWRIAGDDTPTYPAAKPRRKLDYIAFFPADAFEVLSYQVIDDPVSSDHRPAVARIRFKKNSQ